MSQFVPGILSSGVESELSKAIMDMSESYATQMQLVGALLDGESKAGLAQSNATQTAEEQAAQVEMEQANTSLYTGITQTAGFALTTGMRIGREGIGPFKTSELKSIDSDEQNVNAWQKKLQGGESNVMAGKLGANDATEIEMTDMKGKGAAAATKTPNPLAAKDISDDEMDKLRHGLRNGKYAGVNPDSEEGKPTAAAMENLRNLRSSSGKGDPVKLGRLYDDVEKKLNKEQEDVSNRRQSYNSKTERWTQNMQTLTQAATSFAQYKGGYYASEAKTVQANLDALKVMSDYRTQSQKSAADVSMQGSQNSAQTLSQLAQAKEGIAAANRM